jgi:hypothetical protein
MALESQHVAHTGLYTACIAHRQQQSLGVMYEDLQRTRIISSFIPQRLCSSLLSPGLFFSFVMSFTQTVGLLGRVISPSQGQYLHAGQHKHRINAHIDIHALSGIRTHDTSVRASEDSSCSRPRGHSDQRMICSSVALLRIQMYDMRGEISNELCMLVVTLQSLRDESRAVRNRYFQRKREFKERARLLRYTIEKFQFSTKVNVCFCRPIKICCK